MGADAAARLEDAAGDWDLTNVSVLGRGNAALVCGALAAGRPVVVKVNPRGHREEDRLAAEARALRFWSATAAAVEPLGVRDGGLTLLLERLIPGDTLEGEGSDDALAVLGGLARRLHSAGDPGEEFGSLAAYMGDWRPALASRPGLLEHS